jgi:hypothetical protein
MKTQTAFVALAFVLAAPSARTQHASDVFGPAGPGGTIVPGAPFSAGIVTTWERVLPDGKRLHGEAHGNAYRDSQGRTRIESEPEVPDPKLKGVVFISFTDPASHSITYLDLRTKRAIIRGLPTAVPTVAAVPTLANPKPPSDPDAPPPLGIVLSSERPPQKSEELGSRELEGLTVTGTRVTEAVTSGVMQGGGGTTTVTATTWVSTDLKVAVVTEEEDARSDRFGIASLYQESPLLVLW